MKRISTLLAVCLFGILSAFAQGWPAQYGGVMLQGFYWDSFSDSKWTTLESQADELSQYFNLIWVPQSGWCNEQKNMGYHPIWWLKQESAFGTESELRSMIKTFKSKGLGTIADVVINHKNGNTTWTDFPNETKVGENTGKTYSIQWGSDCAPYICCTDECVASGHSATGARDTGTDENGCRDLDHTNTTVQNNIMIYEDFLLNEMGYSGFRYDMVKGFTPNYIAMYNKSSNPTFSVGECWDVYSTISSWINGTKDNGVIQSAAFDFPTRDILKAAIDGNNWNKLNESMLATNTEYQRYAVTFVDNHDTGSSGKDNANPLYKDIEAANAYILSMPGTPCVFLNHWKSYKTTIKKLITLRKLLDIRNQSTIINKGTITNGYYVNVQGINGNALVVLGAGTLSTDQLNGYKLALEGTDYKYYVSNSIDISSLDNIKDDASFAAPSCCVVNPGETCAFFESASSWTTASAYVWDKTGGNTYAGLWPGQECTQVGTLSNGNKVWKWTYTGTTAFEPTTPMIIFNNSKNSGATQTGDMTFYNGGYYNIDKFQGTVTGIRSVYVDSPSTDNAWYTLNGMRISKPSQKGLYIHDGKKYVVK